MLARGLVQALATDTGDGSEPPMAGLRAPTCTGAARVAYAMRAPALRTIGVAYDGSPDVG